MNVSEAIELLKETELKQLKIKDDKPAVLGFINMGVLELHKRFVLWQAEAVITTVIGTSEYLLDGLDANVSIDLTLHNLLKIDEAFNSLGEEISVEDESAEDGIVSPRHGVIKTVTPPIVVENITLTYRASPKFMLHEKAEIPLAPQFLDALFCYVGYRGHGGVKTDIKSENNTHYMRFINSCKQIKTDGLYTPDSLNSTEFEDRGFV